MKILSGLLGAVVLLGVMAFALSNQTAVTLALWPFEAGLTVPLYAVGFAPLLAGLIIGGFVVSLGTWKLRLKLRRLHHDYADLQKASHLTASPQPVGRWKKLLGMK